MIRRIGIALIIGAIIALAIMVKTARGGDITPAPRARRADSVRIVDNGPGIHDTYVGGNQLLRSDTRDTFTVLHGDTLGAWRHFVCGYFMVDSVSGRDSNKVATRDTLRFPDGNYLYGGNVVRKDIHDSIGYGSTDFVFGKSGYGNRDGSPYVRNGFVYYHGNEPLGTNFDSIGWSLVTPAAAAVWGLTWLEDESEWGVVTCKKRPVYKFIVNSGGSSDGAKGYAHMTYPFGINRANTNATLWQYQSQTISSPLAVFDTAGEKALWCIDDTSEGHQRMVTFTAKGDTAGCYGSQIKINNNTDTLLVKVENDTTYFNTTGAAFKFNKPVTRPIAHGMMYFQDAAEVVDVPGSEQYVKITNATNTLFTTYEADYMTIAGDSIILLKPGSYKIDWSFSFSGSNGKDFRVEVMYNGTGLPGRQSQSMTSATNFTNISSVAYLDNADSAGRIGLHVTCITDASDPTFKSGMVFIHRLY